MRHADLDMNRARRGLAASDWDECAYHCQQAAEKSLKALLLHRGKELVWIHKTWQLAQLVDAPEQVAEAGSYLYPAYAAARYPEEDAPFPMFTRTDAEKHLRQAEVVVRWVESMLKQ